MYTLPIDVVIPTRNEELAISAAIESLQGAFSKIHVVDSASTDKTQSLARALGAEVTTFAWNGRYPKKKQWCLDNLDFASPWVLFVDADERVTSAMVDELRSLVEQDWGGHSAFDVPLSYHWLGRELRHGQVVRKRALLRRSDCRFPVIDDLGAPGMGEQEGHYQPIVTGTVGRLVSRLVHDDPDPLNSWISRHNRYSDWEAYLRSNPDVRASVRKARSRQGRLLERLPLKPVTIFFYGFMLKGGFLDGRAGFEYAMSLVVYHWQIGLKVREMRTPSPRRR